MKYLSLLLVLLLLLTGCKSQPETPRTPSASTEISGPAETVDLMPGASPETSALAFYTYDGETVTRRHLFDKNKTEDLLADFQKVKVRPVRLNTADLKPPYYGLEIGGQDGFFVSGLWSQGYFITDDGSAYTFECDFSALEQMFSGISSDTFTDSALLPCAEHAARTVDGWNVAFLTQAEEPAGEKGISMELISASQQEVIVNYVNRSKTEWTYGLFAELQVRIGGKWYNLPTGSNYAVISIAMLVPAGKSAEQSYGLKPWGDLFPGTYRLVSNGLSAEFTVK